MAFSIYGKQEKEMERLQAERDQLLLDQELVDSQAKSLNELDALVGSDQYIERVARDNLGLVRPDEIIFLHK